MKEPKQTGIMKIIELGKISEHTTNLEGAMTLYIQQTEDTENALILIVDSSIESWILDLGASFHSLSKELFQNLKREIFCKVYLADNKNLDD